MFIKATLNILHILMTVYTQTAEKIIIIKFSLNAYCKWFVFMYTVIADSQLTFFINMSNSSFTICSVNAKTI